MVVTVMSGGMTMLSISKFRVVRDRRRVRTVCRKSASPSASAAAPAPTAPNSSADRLSFCTSCASSSAHLFSRRAREGRTQTERGKRERERMDRETRKRSGTVSGRRANDVAHGELSLRLSTRCASHSAPFSQPIRLFLIISIFFFFSTT